MNQILATQKIYMTPEIKRKKLMLKIQFCASLICVVALSSYYVYAEYNRARSEEVSKAILAEVNIDTTIKKAMEEEDDLLILVNSDDFEDGVQSIDFNEVFKAEEIPSTYIGADNKEYNIEAIINIPKIDIKYPVLSETSDELLEISVNKYWGPAPNTVGNYCIAGHNYKNGTMFGSVSKLTNGDRIELTDLSGITVIYEVYDRYVVAPTDTTCTSQLTNGKKEVTLITCTTYGQERLIVKCREV